MRIYTTITPVYSDLVKSWMLDSLASMEPDADVHVEVFEEIEADGDFGTAEFNHHNRRKAEKISEWIGKADGGVIFVCDADVIFLRPFQERLRAELGDYDIALSPEHLSRSGYNIGQVVIRCSEKTARFYKKIADSLAAATWDQELINSSLPDSGLSHKALSPFFSNTLIWRDIDNSARQSLFSYHATETFPSNGKTSIQLKQELIDEVRASRLVER